MAPRAITIGERAHRRLNRIQQTKEEADMKGLTRTTNLSLRGVAMMATAIGAIAVGAFAIGALAIGRLAVRRIIVESAKLKSVEIEDLTVTRLRAVEVTVSDSLELPGDETARSHEAGRKGSL
jgi:hypothetical protein